MIQEIELSDVCQEQGDGSFYGMPTTEMFIIARKIVLSYFVSGKLALSL